MSKITRPKPGEDEEELLQQQKDFYSKNIKVSVNLVNKQENQNRAVSKFASKNKRRKKECQSAIGSSILGDIKEKMPDFANWQMSCLGSDKGFPEAFSSGVKEDKKIKESVFSEHLSQQRSEFVCEHLGACAHEQTTDFVGSQSFIVSGPDSVAIHEENIKKIYGMSKEEIYAQQEYLRSSLDPQLLEFILSRRKKQNVNVVKMEVDSEVSDERGSVSSVKTSCGNIEKSIGEKPLSSVVRTSLDVNNTWLHMDVLEEDKFLWMGDIPSAKNINPEQPYNARFDFQGLLLPYVMDNVDVREGLYNHGNEPERPGYSLEELLQLSRSSVQQQRVIALNIISNVLEKAKKGYYDECFSEGLLSLLLDHELFLLLRFTLDDNSEATLVSSLTAMKNLLCSEVDELCFDRALGCSGFLCQPFLAIDSQMKDNTSKSQEMELKDYELLKLDVIKGAVRSDIIPRMRYILETLKPCPSAVLACLNILIRLARHSGESVQAIVQCPRLLEIIVKNFVPRDWTTIVASKKPSEMQTLYNKPVVDALKLLRVISVTHQIKRDLVQKYHTMDSIMSYISIDPRDCSLPLEEVLRLTLNSFYLWQMFLVSDLGVQQFIDLHPVLMKLLQYHLSCTSVDENSSSFSHEHGIALISLIEQAVNIAQFHKTSKKSTEPTLANYHIKDFCVVLEMCVSKWLTQSQTVANFTFSSVKLIGASLNCLAVFYHYQLDELGALTSLNKIETFFESFISPFLSSSGFQGATSNLKMSSCLLHDGQLGSQRDPHPLPSVGSLMWKGKCLTPVLQQKSCIPLMQGLFNLFQTVYAIHKELNAKYVDALLCNNYLVDYIKEINSQDILSMATHWFTRIEVNMLGSFLKLMSQKNCHSISIHCLAFQLIKVIQRVDKHMLYDIMAHVVFNPNFFMSASVCNEIAALQLVSSSSNQISRKEIVRQAFDDLSMIWVCFKNCLGFNDFQSINTNLELDSIIEDDSSKLLLSDEWHYTPIVSLYKKEKSSIPADEDTASQVIRTLQWMLLLEELRPDVTAAIPVADRFCNLSKVFLIGSDLFLDQHVHQLLSYLLGYLMQHYKEIKFPPSFYDLFTLLLEQFAAVSYSDSLFGQFLLVPLRQRCSCDLRKQIWSEHAAVLRILCTGVDELMFPLSEMLEPCETDHSLLQNYLQCLATGIVQETWCPVLYKVALHHVSTFLSLYSDSSFAEQLRTKIMRMGNKNLQLLLLNKTNQR